MTDAVINGIAYYSPRMRDVVIAIREARASGARSIRYETRDGHQTIIVDVVLS